MSSKRRKKGGRRFIQLWTNVKRSEAYHGLDSSARCTLIEMLDKYTGINNGIIVMGCRELTERLHCAPSTAARALHDLDDAGLATPTEVGVWRGRKATTWRLMFYRCDKTGDIPVHNWPEHIPSSSGATQKPRSVRVAARKARDCSRSDTQKPHSSMNENAVSSRSGTHIDIYQRDSGRDGGTVPASVQLAARRRLGIRVTDPSLNGHPKKAAKSTCEKGGGNGLED